MVTRPPPNEVLDDDLEEPPEEIELVLPPPPPPTLLPPEPPRAPPLTAPPPLPPPPPPLRLSNVEIPGMNTMVQSKDLRMFPRYINCGTEKLGDIYTRGSLSNAQPTSAHLGMMLTRLRQAKGRMDIRHRLLGYLCSASGIDFIRKLVHVCERFLSNQQNKGKRVFPENEAVGCAPCRSCRRKLWSRAPSPHSVRSGFCRKKKTGRKLRSHERMAGRA